MNHIEIPNCTVCGNPLNATLCYEPDAIDDATARRCILFNETCNSCWTWSQEIINNTTEEE